MKRFKKIIIPGGSGFIGQLLVAHWQDCCEEIIVLTRGKERKEKNVSYLHWDGTLLPSQFELLEGADLVINLTGKSVDCRYHAKNRKVILESRVRSTESIAQGISECAHPPHVWMNMSSATVYRYAEDKEMSEKEGEIGTGFSVGIVQAWEKAVDAFPTPNTRKILLRTGIVMGNSGGGFVPLKRLARFGLGGKAGHGRQYISWIHEADLLRMLDWAMENSAISGPLNVTGPEPTPNKVFMRSLREALGVPFGLPSPAWLLAIGTFFLQTEAELILKSRRVSPQKALKGGFNFHYGKLEDALGELTGVAV